MIKNSRCFFVVTVLMIFIQSAVSCAGGKAPENQAGNETVIEPIIITEAVPHDTDDPAIWINPDDKGKSLIIGTDKDVNGALYVYDLEGHILHDKSVMNIKRPNNVDVEYGLNLAGKPVDIAVTTERVTHKLRIFRVPEMTPVDNGGIEVFKGETGPEERDLMGISLYKRPDDGAVFAIVGRKTGPSGSYLWQYLLHDDGTGNVAATLVRKFGEFSGNKEIEAIAVDDAPGYIYYSDEGVGVRKYYADPSRGNTQLALFAQKGFTKDHEGISIYTKTDSTGYIIVSDQGADKFCIYPREGSNGNPHSHPLLKVVKVKADDSDGSEVTSVPLGKLFPEGLFVAMSTDRTFHYYSWKDIIGD